MLPQPCHLLQVKPPVMAGASGLLDLGIAELNPVASPVCLLALLAPIRVFDTGSYVAQASLEFLVLLPPVFRIIDMRYRIQFMRDWR